MSQDRPDIATLDALVLGTDGPEERPAWTQLISAPDSARRWAEATARRAKLDRLAELLEAHAWLAVVLDRVRRFKGARAQARLEVSLDPSPLFASLGPTEDDATVLASPRWGHIEPVIVGLGAVVELRVTGAEAGTARVFYQRASGAQGLLPEGRWRMDAGEAPVLLVVCTQAASATTLDEALATTTAAAGVLLTEGPAS